MHEITDADLIFKEMMAENPDFAKEIIMEFREEMPEEYIRTMIRAKWGCHIYNEKDYQKALTYIKPQDGYDLKIISIEDGERLLKEYIKDYNDEDFYLYDALLWLNVRKNDYPRISDMGRIAYIVYEDLHDSDLPYDASERAYKWYEMHKEKERENLDKELNIE